MKTLLTITEACAETGLGRTKLYDEMAAGRLGYVKVGSRRLVPGDALTAYVELLKSETTRAA